MKDKSVYLIGEAYSDVAEKICNWELMKNCIYPMLVSKDRVADDRNRFVHRPFLNVEVIYYVTVTVHGEAAIIKITEALSRYWGVTEEEIHSDAMRNLENQQYQVQDLLPLLVDLTGGALEETVRNEKMYVVWNEKGRYGAAGILSRNIMKKCADRIGQNFYLLPSSIHEMVLVPDTGTISADEFRIMVTEINQEIVALEERLCDEVFYYDVEEQSIRIVE